MSLRNKLTGIKSMLTITVMFVLAAVLAVTSCGGGGGATFSGGGVSGTGRSSGTITGFGSVHFKDVTFETTPETVFNVNGLSDADELDLKVGMKVTVDYEDNVATSITYEPEVKGPVSNIVIDVFGLGSFDVLGQHVIVNSGTEFCFNNDHETCNFNFALLRDGNDPDFVEVSGFFDSDGNIIATMVKKEESEEYEVKGTVLNHDPEGKTFTINNLTVDYSGVSDSPVIANGDLVDVEGLLNGMGDVLIANSIVVEDTQETSGLKLELEGIVTQFTSLSDFEVNGQKVQTNGQTEFTGDPDTIALDVRVEVKGTINDDGVLVASAVEIEDTDIED